MLFSLLSNNENNDNALDVLKNPFMGDKIKTVRFYIYPKHQDNKWKANIEFVNGDTKGEQSFQNKDFSLLVKQVENFIKAL